MANLIITVIAIALVAISAAMGAYYGGSTFLGNQAAANGATVLTQAEQVRAAWQAFETDHSYQVPSAYSDLTTNNYLSQVPNVPAMLGTGIQPMGMAMVGTKYFAYADMGDPGVDTKGLACLRVIKSATQATRPTIGAAQPYGSIYNSGLTNNNTFNCAVSSGAAPTALGGSVATGGYIPPSGHYVMEYLLQ